MRIQLICAAFPPFGKGGGPVTSELLARALVAAGHEIEVVTASDTPLDEQREGYRVRSIGSPNLYADYWSRHPAWQRAAWHMLENFNPRAYLRMRREIRRFKPDLVATVSIENINVATWAAARRERVPTLHFLHSYFLLCWRGSLFKNGQRCATRCGSCKAASFGKTRLASLVDGVVGESRFIIDKHREHGLFREARPFVLPTPASEGTDPTPRALPAPSTPVTIGYLGNFSAEKGVATLAEAARLLHARHGDAVRFVVAGSGPPAIEAELHAAFPAKATRFLGWTKAEDVYAQTDIVVVPSIWDEPYGRVSVEPLRHGIPVVAARSGGLTENVEDGVSGRLFTPGNPADLAVTLNELIENRGELAALGKGAREHASRYTFPVFVETLDRMVRHMGSLDRSPLPREALCHG